MLPQWMEYNHMHGVEHFLVYTTDATDPTEFRVLRPYFEAGVATRVHVEIPSWMKRDFSAVGYSTQAWFANDCVHRMKHHAKWLLPTLDVDEYLRPVAPKGNGVHKYDFDAVESDWLATRKGSKETTLAHSVSFLRYVFRYPEAPASELQISSPWRHKTNTGFNYNYLPKFVVRPALVNIVTAHWATSWLPGSVGIFAPKNVFVVHHYRTDDVEETPVEDTSLVVLVPDVSKAITHRFQLAWPELYARFSPSSTNLLSLSGAEGRDVDQRNETFGFQTWVRVLSEIDRAQILPTPFSD